MPFMKQAPQEFYNYVALQVPDHRAWLIRTFVPADLQVMAQDSVDQRYENLRLYLEERRTTIFSTCKMY